MQRRLFDDWDWRVALFRAVLGGVIVIGSAVLLSRYLGGDDLPPSAPLTAQTSAGPTTTPTPPVDSAPTETPSTVSTPTTTPEPTTGPTVSEMEALRESDMWLGLAEWDRATVDGKEAFFWGSTSADLDCQYGRFSNEEEVWNAFAPGLREEMLQLVITDQIQPESVRFRGKPFEDAFVAGVLPWWSNGESGTQGRGSMYIAEASYYDAAGEPRIRQWPVLIGHGTEPNASREADLRAVGPVQDLALQDVPNTIEGANQQFNEHHAQWLFEQEPINPSLNPPLPCGT